MDHSHIKFRVTSAIIYWQDSKQQVEPNREVHIYMATPAELFSKLTTGREENVHRLFRGVKSRHFEGQSGILKNRFAVFSM
jgi:hypothetical protein